jgi:hypothetical protein
MNKKMTTSSSEVVLNFLSERLENPVPGYSIQDAIKDLLSNDDLPDGLSFEIGLQSWHLYKRLLEADNYQKQLSKIDISKSLEQRVNKAKANDRRWQATYDKLFNQVVYNSYSLSFPTTDFIRCLKRLRDVSNNLSSVYTEY